MWVQVRVVRLFAFLGLLLVSCARAKPVSRDSNLPYQSSFLELSSALGLVVSVMLLEQVTVSASQSLLSAHASHARVLHLPGCSTVVLWLVWLKVLVAFAIASARCQVHIGTRYPILVAACCCLPGHTLRTYQGQLGCSTKSAGVHCEPAV